MPPITVAIIGVCNRGCIHDIKRNINPSAAIAYRTRGNGKSEPSNEANIPRKRKTRLIVKSMKNYINKDANCPGLLPVNAPAPMIYLNIGN